MSERTWTVPGELDGPLTVTARPHPNRARVIAQLHPRDRGAWLTVGEARHLAAALLAAADHTDRAASSGPVWTGLTPVQADGLACVWCGQSYVHDGGPHRPVGIAATTGSQVFACDGVCAEQAAAEPSEGRDAA